MDFQAEIVETKQTKSYSGLDNNYTIKFRTNNPLILDLGKLPPQTLCKVGVELTERQVEYGQDVVKKVELNKSVDVRRKHGSAKKGNKRGSRKT